MYSRRSFRWNFSFHSHLPSVKIVWHILWRGFRSVKTTSVIQLRAFPQKLSPARNTGYTVLHVYKRMNKTSTHLYKSLAMLPLHHSVYILVRAPPCRCTGRATVNVRVPPPPANPRTRVPVQEQACCVPSGLLLRERVVKISPKSVTPNPCCPRH